MQAGHAGFTSWELCKGALAAPAPILQAVSAPGDEGSESHCSISEEGVDVSFPAAAPVPAAASCPRWKKGRGSVMEGWENRGRAVSMAALHLVPLLRTSCFSLAFWAAWGRRAIFRRTLKGCEAGKAWVEHRWGLWMQALGEGVLQSCHAGMGGGGG